MKFIIVVLLTFVWPARAGVYQYSTMEDNCQPNPDNWTVTVNTNGNKPQGIIQLLRSEDFRNYWPGMNCSMTLEPHPDYTLFLVVDKLDIYETMPGNCSLDYLRISNEDMSRTYCGHTQSNIEMSVNVSTVVRFVSQSDVTSYNGFRIFYNLYHTNSCSSDEFTCHTPDSRCVSNRLKCDTNDNCGDSSDEACPGWTTFAVIALIALILLVGFTIFTLIRLKIAKSKETEECVPSPEQEQNDGHQPQSREAVYSLFTVTSSPS